MIMTIKPSLADGCGFFVMFCRDYFSPHNYPNDDCVAFFVSLYSEESEE